MKNMIDKLKYELKVWEKTWDTTKPATKEVVVYEASTSHVDYYSNFFAKNNDQYVMHIVVTKYNIFQDKWITVWDRTLRKDFENQQCIVDDKKFDKFIF